MIRSRDQKLTKKLLPGVLLNTSRAFMTFPRMVVLLLLITVLLAACGGQSGESWAGLSANHEADTIYVAYNERIVALNATSGAAQWDYPPKDDRDAKFFAVPVVDNGTLYVGDYKGQLHAINTDDGSQEWVYEPERTMLIGPVSPTPLDRVIGGVAVDSNLVFFGLGSRNVVAISRETAEEVWTFKTDHGVWATPLYLSAEEDHSGKATVYVVSLDHFLYAIEAQTGKKLWRKDLGGAAPGNIVYDAARNWVYVGTFVSEVVAVDLTTHEIVDRHETEDWVWGHPALEEDMLYFGDLSGTLYAVQVTDEGFQQAWQRSVSGGAIRAAPLLTEELVIVASQNKYVYAVSKDDGADQWSVKTKGEALTELLLVPGDPEDTESGDLVIVGTDSKNNLVMAYTFDAGSEVWNYSD